MKYQLVELEESKILEEARKLGEFIVADLAKVLKRDPSALSPYIHKMVVNGSISIIGRTYIKDAKGRNQLMKVYKA